VPTSEFAEAARVIAVPGTVLTVRAGVRRLTTGGAPTGEITSRETWVSRAAPALSVARAETTNGRESSPAVSSGAV